MKVLGLITERYFSIYSWNKFIQIIFYEELQIGSVFKKIVDESQYTKILTFTSGQWNKRFLNAVLTSSACNMIW
jgi:hypothetical protein